jgi:hypothetical protein
MMASVGGGVGSTVFEGKISRNAVTSTSNTAAMSKGAKMANRTELNRWRLLIIILSSFYQSVL